MTAAYRSWGLGGCVGFLGGLRLRAEVWSVMQGSQALGRLSSDCATIHARVGSSPIYASFEKEIQVEGPTQDPEHRTLPESSEPRLFKFLINAPCASCGFIA